MSTRATIHFATKLGEKPTAIIYRHGDGYPEGLGKDLADFVAELKANVKDPRFNDPSYLAAKWVVCDAMRMNAFARQYQGATHPLEFLSVGILDQDAGDADYRYTVICSDNGKEPTIVCEAI